MKNVIIQLSQIFYGDIICKFIPVKDNYVLFSSFYGQHYSDGPRLISENLHQRYPEIKIFWEFNDKTVPDIPGYITPVQMNTFDYTYVKSVAGTTVTNVYSQAGFLGNNKLQNIITRVHLALEYRKKQKRITTWHGTPLKRMGNDEVGAITKRFICNSPLYYIAGNQFEEEVMLRLTDGRLKTLPWGSPRNCKLTNEYTSLSSTIRKKIGIDSDTRIVLFAPTFRYNKSKNGVDAENSGIKQLEILQFDCLERELQKKFGGQNWKLICRFHNSVEKYIDWDEINIKYSNRVMNGNVLEDIIDYYTISDIVITDYSSVMFDFMVTKKPVFLLCHDYINYANCERGFYFKMDELPFAISDNYSSIVNNIRVFNQKDYASRIDAFMKRLGYYDNTKVLDKISDFIAEGEMGNET